jgi:DNA-directed RNA polymerase subunit M/transcription elongation factor TFIIS
MEAGSTNEVHFCSKCENMSYLHLYENEDTGDKELVYYCRACSNREMVPETSRCVYTLNFKGYDKSELLNANKYISHDITLPTIQGNPNIRCTNSECPSVTTHKESSIKYIKYDAENMRYLYICNHCGQKWRNS